ncbi:MAG: hypothetical protein LBE92_09540 [Chryseobacterium sp.]|jgi:hypothetical protein|uniref:hypothetical protein n=1 Tax=Chryseobacterium sp. TaxID=1871047 RepID=UPI002825FD9F|nr:hypothetical protein [Chryseobacterium sp.]MDR2236356.1 hypothetical protein [Chryseobacterium sp.]
MGTYWKDYFRKHIPVKTGAICTLISLALACTGLASIATVASVAFAVELLISAFGEYREGLGGLLVLTAVFILALLSTFFAVRNLSRNGFSITQKELFLIMFIFYWIVHPLGFYLYWGIFTDFSQDAQIILGAIFSFPFSSFFFIILGLMIDAVMRKYSPLKP